MCFWDVWKYRKYQDIVIVILHTVFMLVSFLFQEIQNCDLFAHIYLWRGQIFEISEKQFYFWILHPKVSLYVSFHARNIFISIDIELNPFPLIWSWWRLAGVKYLKYLKTDFIFEFSTLKLPYLQISVFHAVFLRKIWR